MNCPTSRRSFLKKSAAAVLAAPLVTSLEEYALAAQETNRTMPAPAPGSRGTMPLGVIGGVKISRIICGGNLISGYAHSRDLIYVSKLLKAYHTEEKVMETWARCEEYGINTMIFTPADQRALRIFSAYRARGGKMQCLAQLAPNGKDEMGPCIKEAVDAGCEGALLVGNYGDQWTREGALDWIAEFIDLVKLEGIIAGVAGHELRTPMAVEKAGIKPDFYMKTLHSANYWSARRSDQMKEVIDNYGTDNYWCMDPEGTIKFMKQLKRPWLAYKVLAAGAIPPRQGFQYAFENGADFCVVGMFDFQIAENAGVANAVLRATQKRERAWLA